MCPHRRLLLRPPPTWPKPAQHQPHNNAIHFTKGNFACVAHDSEPPGPPMTWTTDNLVTNDSSVSPLCLRWICLLSHPLLCLCLHMFSLLPNFSSLIPL